MAWLKRFDPFETIYVAISIATFSHTQIAAATIFEGPMPVDTVGSIAWLVKGALVAIAFDVGMLFAARSLARKRSLWMAVAFGTAAFSSFYTQLWFAVTHVPAMRIGDGVTPYWQETLAPITDARVLVMPLLLPVMAVVYTLARIEKSRTRIVVSGSVTGEENGKPDSVEATSNEIVVSREEPKLLTDGLMDHTQLRFYDEEHARWRGPFKSPKSMEVAYKSMLTRRENRRQRRG